MGGWAWGVGGFCLDSPMEVFLSGFFFLLRFGFVVRRPGTLWE